jgi:4-alpha-glucanotransferase
MSVLPIRHESVWGEPGVRDVTLELRATILRSMASPTSIRQNALSTATTHDKAPLIGTKICAEHYLEQTGEALLAIGRYKALRTYLQQLPVSPRKV